MNKHTLRIYGGGGVGANALIHGINIPEELQNAGVFPRTQAVILDTSDANIRGMEEQMLDLGITAFLVPDARGFGKDRTKAYKAISPHIATILQENPAGDYNIVIGGTSGASGSIFAHLLTMELLKRGENVVVILVGSIASAIEADSAKKVIEGLQGACESSKRSLPFVYLENASSPNEDMPWQMPQGDADKEIDRVVGYLAMMTSGNLTRLDHRDVSNFLHPDKVVKSVPPQLTQLVVGKTNDDHWSEYVGKTITTMSARQSSDTGIPALESLYDTEGFYKPEIHTGNKLSDALPSTGLEDLLLATTTKDVAAIYEHLTEVCDTYESHASNLSKASAISSSSDMGGDCMVL